MKIPCPECGSPISGEQADTRKQFIKCPHCHTKLETQQVVSQFRLLDWGITSSYANNRLQLIMPWFHFAYVIILLFYAVANAVGFNHIMTNEIEVWLICIGFVLDLLIGYWIAVQLFNRTVVTVDAEQLTIDHRPFYWPIRRGHAIPLNELKSLYIKKVGGHRSDENRLDRSAISYFLCAETTDEKQITLTPARPDRGQLQAIKDSLDDGTRKVGLSAMKSQGNE